MKFRNSTLAYRTLVVLVLTSTVFSVGSILYQIRNQYKYEQQAQASGLSIIKDSYVPSVASALFYFNDQQLLLLVEGMLLLPHVDFVGIQEYRSTEYFDMLTLGSRAGEYSESHYYPLTYVFGEQERLLGRLEIRTNYSRLRSRIMGQLQLNILVDVLRLFFFALMLFVLWQRMVFRHLWTMSDFLNSIDPAVSDQPRLELQRSAKGFKKTDELEKIRLALNSMLDRLETGLHEKETLIQELYHRTHNNMQVIQGMLAYRLAAHPELPLETFVEDIIAQIRAMALAHQELYRRNNLSRIDLGEYLRSLATMAVERQHPGFSEVKLVFKLAPCEILLDTAVPFGTVINELLSNVMRHAFPDSSCKGGDCKLLLSLDVRSDAWIEVCIKDNGIGFDPELCDRLKKKGGLGLAVALVEQQLEGSIEFDCENGFCCRICFKDRLYKERV